MELNSKSKLYPTVLCLLYIIHECKPEKLDWHYHDYDELLLNTNNKHNKYQQFAFYKKLLLHKLKYYEADYNLQLITTKPDKNDYKVCNCNLIGRF